MQSKSLKLVEYTSQMVKPTENDTVYYASKDDVVGYYRVPFALLTYSDGRTEKVKNPVTFSGSNITDLVSIVFPEETINIDIRSCSALSSVTYTDSVKKLFIKECASITSVPTIPNNITTLSFNSCSSLGYVEFGSNLSSYSTLDSNAFQYCTSLTQITFPSQIHILGSRSFFSSGIESVIIPATITSINGEVFKNCKSLTSVTISNPVSFGASPNESAFGYCSNLKTVTLNAQKTGRYTFEHCTSLSNLELINTKAIGLGSFQYCTSLTEVTLPSSITALASTCFFGCRNLKSFIYQSTMDDWGNVSKGQNWHSYTINSGSGYNYEIGATIHCTNGDITLTPGERT